MAVNQQNLDTLIRTLNVQLSRVYSLQAELHGLNGGHLTRLVSRGRKDGVTEGTIRSMLTTLKWLLIGRNKIAIYSLII